MADPFALINRSMARNAAAKGGYPGGGRGGGGGGAGYPGGRRRKVLDPSKPKDIEYLRRMHPDFDEVMLSANVDYKTICHTDANFASKYRIPPVMEPQQAFREHLNSVDAVAWGPEPGGFVSASHDGTLKVWDLKSGACTDTLQGHVAGVYHCAVASSKKLLISCGSGEEKNVLLWKWPEKRVSAQLEGHRRSVLHATFSPDGCSAATVDQDGCLLVHDLERGSCRLRLGAHVGPAHGSAFCATDPNLLVTAGADGSIQLLDIREQLAPKSWQLPSAVANSVSVSASLGVRAAHDGYAVHAAEFVDGTTVFSGGADHKLKRWDLRALAPSNPKCVGQYLGHTAPVRSLAVSADQRFVVTGCEDGSLRVWPRDPLGEVRSSLRGIRAEIKQVEAQLQDAQGLDNSQQKLTQRLEELKQAAAPMRDSEAQMSRDGYVPALRTLNGHVGLVSGVCWQESSDKRAAYVLSSSWDQSIQLFNISLDDLA